MESALITSPPSAWASRSDSSDLPAAVAPTTAMTGCGRVRFSMITDVRLPSPAKNVRDHGRARSGGDANGPHAEQHGLAGNRAVRRLSCAGGAGLPGVARGGTTPPDRHSART